MNPRRAEEYFADAQATIATVISAAKLDVVPPEFPLAAAIFALACLDLLQRAYHVLQIGKETGSNAESETHPKTRDRATAIIDRFRQYFDLDYRPADRTFDLTFVVRPEPPEVHNFTSEGRKKAYAYANIHQIVWEPVKDRLLEDFRRKRPLHPLWQ